MRVRWFTGKNPTPRTIHPNQIPSPHIRSILANLTISRILPLRQKADSVNSSFSQERLTWHSIHLCLISLPPDLLFYF